MKTCTVLFLNKPSERKLLLAMKKRGFGTGKWNGVGGKVVAPETIEQAAIREAHEEISINVKEQDLIEVAIIDFYFENKKELDQNVHVFLAEVWEGEPTESEEMKPSWFSYEDIPYGDMWIDDILWLPRVLEGEKLKAMFVFNESGDKLLRNDITFT